MNPQFLFVGGFVITAGYIAYTDIHDCSELPWPPRIVATGLVFGMLDLFSAMSPELAGITAIGFMLAMIVNGKLHSVCKSPKPCQCASQASDTVGLPPPKVVEPNPTGPLSQQEAPRGGTFLEPGTAPPELPPVEIP